MSASDASMPGVSDGRAWVHRFFVGRTLHDCLESRRDNILYLRLLAASAVVFGHCGLGGRSQVPYDFVHALFPATYMHVLGLIMFFVISGFLVSSSYARHPHLLRFLWARALRIWPALVVCALGVAFLLGPLLTTWSLGEYLSPARDTGPYDYVWHSVTVFHVRDSISGVFDTNPVWKIANGPLWTIPVESTMYLWVAGAGLLRLYRVPWLTSLAIAGIFSVLILWPMMTGPFPTLNTPLSVQGFFGAGAIAYLLRRHIPVSTGLMIALALACFAARHTIHATPFVWLAIAYFVFWFSYVPQLPRMPRNVDLSYGTYLWGCPIQQSIVHAWHVADPIALFFLTMAIVLPIAAASWLLIEKPALAMKDRAPWSAAGTRSPLVRAAAESGTA
ncbi:MAG TPA: acyltransferase [Rhodanobacteraceae bacterium]|nr:acyltransferase [Rhodanobacteraceae bacterium]